MKHRMQSVLLGLGLLGSACDLQHGPNPNYQEPEDASDAGSDDADMDAAPDADMPQDAEADSARDSSVRDSGCACTSPSAPVCTAAGACVECTATDHRACAGDKTVCGPSNACVQCTENDKTACATPTPACDPQTHLCVACNMDLECAEATPVCTAHRCEKCSQDAHCTRFGKVCDEAAGSCVACTIDSEALQCGNNSCNPATKLCTQTPRASVPQCQTCVADSECETNHRCLEMFFGTGATRMSLGGRCMKRLSSGCSFPYSGAPISRQSLSGAPAENYCGIAEARTSCEAIRKLQQGAGCPTGADAACGAPGGLCRTVNGTSNLCTYACEASAECPTVFACPTSGNDKYCGKN